ncbi:hypothetical protein MVES1_001015 [Malassezia vespertilionis]|uniref:Thioredoxin domain-containing protein n=1 Tax=Malassezia vespertilionis TaxID=2020962 RepID=A0A2N1JFI4_9BASI|nr:uncharacterized protein MVES1_001015 [Malassezia vespertilionis]PKI85307.1 hypothetical protein MVES_000952 [Malassezia vespertilionis]WFD05683.1 hypothetical protein MVES1_001015 [Malassezia vespertilionis]
MMLPRSVQMQAFRIARMSPAHQSVRFLSQSPIARKVEEDISGERLGEILQEKQQQGAEGVPLLVDFFAEWCGPCKQLSPILLRLASSPELVGGRNIDLVTVDVDKNMEVAQMFQVRAMPTVVAIKDGKHASTFVGLLPEPKLKEFIENL